MVSTSMKGHPIVIMGGGLAGLYLLHLLMKARIRDRPIYLYERGSHLGGRIQTTNFYGNNIEEGAARFCKGKHKLVEKLVRELCLQSDVKATIGAKIRFVPHHGYSGDSHFRQESPYMYIQKVIQASRKAKRETLQSMTFFEYASKVLKESEANFIRDSFGYSGEIVAMNAFDSIKMFKSDLNQNLTYLSLKHGLSQIVRRITKKAKLFKNIKIFTKSEITQVKTLDEDGSLSPSIEYTVKRGRKEKTLIAGHFISAVTKSTLERLEITKPVRQDIQSIITKPLCRMYMVFRKKDSQWMEGLTKTTSNHLGRYLIPLGFHKGQGLIMISYTDGEYADKIKYLKDTKGIKLLQEEILKLWATTFHLPSLPKPLATKLFYWKEGIGLWKPGVDSREISKRLLQPIPKTNFYICGENYSQHQAWMEGALQTAEAVFKKIKKSL